MMVRHKSKTVASLLSVAVGSLGFHRLYLHGRKDLWAWIYLCTTAVYIGIVAIDWRNGSLSTSVPVLFPLPVFIAAIEALVIGLTDDMKWDRKHNAQSGTRSRSGWPLAVLLVVVLLCTFTAFIASLARATDLFLTGGSFG